MSTETHAVPNYGKYLVIWAFLIALLAAGTFVSYLPISRTGIALIILGISLVKTALVGLYFMHMKFEKFIPIWAVAVFPFFLLGLAGLLIFLGLTLIHI